LFGNFSVDNDEKATKISSSNGEGKVHQIGGSNRGNGEQDQHLRMAQEQETSRVDQPEVHGQSHLSNQSLAGGYGGYLPTRPGHFAIPPYGAAPHYSYENTEVHYAGYEAVPDAQAQAMQMRPGMMPYDPQPYQPTSQYQREPSPSTDTKYLSSGASRADNAQNAASGYRENKFSAQDGNSGGTAANTAAQGTHTATPGYPYPMYTYPYGMPNQLQYASSQYPQHPGHPGHQQYFPRYYRPTPYPNYSGNVNTINTAGYPNIPTGPTATPSYAEDMVQADYKNMFPGTPFFHSGDTNLGNIMGKQTPSNPVNQQGTSAPQQGSKQNFSNSQSVNAPSTQGGTSPDLATGAYKNQQQPAYQNTSIPPRDTSAPNSFYNMVQQPQYGQQTSTSFPYGAMHSMQAPQQYRGQQQYQS
jgi:hypothetical protein